MSVTIEFSHTVLTLGTTEADLVSRVLAFENAYLTKRPAFLFHALVTNGKGRYGHLVVASEREAFSLAMREAPDTPTMGALMAALDMDKIQMRTHSVLDETFEVPRFFGCFEQGVFRPNNEEEFDSEVFVHRAEKVRSQYLEGRPEFLAQTVADAGDGLYSELVFTASLAHAEKTCAGYLESPICAPLLELCDPETTDLTFWTPLLQRSLC